jgi:hypothetical protein
MDIQRLGPNLDRSPRDATLVSTRVQRRAPVAPQARAFQRTFGVIGAAPSGKHLGHSL